MSDSPASFHVKQLSSDSISSRNLFFATSAENLCGCHACDGGAFTGGGSSSGGGVSSFTCGILRHRCLLFCRFHKLICCPLNQKDKSSPSVFLVHPQFRSSMQGSICVSQRSMQCLY